MFSEAKPIGFSHSKPYLQDSISQEEIGEIEGRTVKEMEISDSDTIKKVNDLGTEGIKKVGLLAEGDQKSSILSPFDVKENYFR